MGPLFLARSFSYAYFSKHFADELSCRCDVKTIECRMDIHVRRMAECRMHIHVRRMANNSDINVQATGKALMPRWISDMGARPC